MEVLESPIAGMQGYRCRLSVTETRADPVGSFVNQSHSVRLSVGARVDSQRAVQCSPCPVQPTILPSDRSVCSARLGSRSAHGHSVVSHRKNCTSAKKRLAKAIQSGDCDDGAWVVNMHRYKALLTAWSHGVSQTSTAFPMPSHCPQAAATAAADLHSANFSFRRLHSHQSTFTRFSKGLDKR
jgi:hypothetical protein